MKDDHEGISRSEFIKLTAGAGLAAGLSIAALPGTAEAVRRSTGPVRWGFLVDLRRCIGCNACTIACKAEFDVRLGVYRSSVGEKVSCEFPFVKRIFIPWLCNHCANPPCIENCPVDEMEAVHTFPDGSRTKYLKRATYQRPDGVVLIDQNRCIGCGACVNDCPYGVRYLDPVKSAGGLPEMKAADKCTLCAHRLAEGVVPSCVNTCQGRARKVGNLKDPKSEISRLIASNQTRVLRPELKTDPQCYYIGLDEDFYAQIEESNKMNKATLAIREGETPVQYK
jgi:tetrathionate reductase subunit B